MNAAPAFDLAPLLGILCAGALLAAGPLLWWRMRRRDCAPGTGLRALALMTLFLSFDLVLFGAFTRLSDSGLGCPDWPGCYGQASPIGARAPIASAEAAIPTGAVTPTKAWIEMAHRYGATAIGVLIVALALLALRAERRGVAGIASRWAWLTLLWVCLQGAFGALTVTMRLYPAIVTLHLLGGLGLLALLAVQAETYRPQPLPLSPALRTALLIVAGLVVLQIALGGWVSSNYAVLACRDVPTCQGVWWPDMDLAAGFSVRRTLGTGGDGAFLPFAALTAIHMVHRLGAAVVMPAIALLAWRMRARGGDAGRFALALAALLAWQAASGLGNVLLGWPLVAAVAHTAGAAGLVVVFTILVVRSAPERSARRPARVAARPGLAS
jgi:cytochrome c oxidase assembly protein subunit 15